MNIFKKIKAHLMYRYAVKKADKAHSDTGNRYYVIPAVNKKLVLVDRKNFRLLRQKHYIDRTLRINDLALECFYHTPYRDGSGAMLQFTQHRKKRQFLIWYLGKR